MPEVHRLLCNACIPNCAIILYSTELSVNRWVTSMEKVKVRSGWTTYAAWEQKRTLLTVDVQNGVGTTVDITKMCQSPVNLVRQSAPSMSTTLTTRPMVNGHNYDKRMTLFALLHNSRSDILTS